MGKPVEDDRKEESPLAYLYRELGNHFQVLSNDKHTLTLKGAGEHGRDATVKLLSGKSTIRRVDADLVFLGKPPKELAKIFQRDVVQDTPSFLRTVLSLSFLGKDSSGQSAALFSLATAIGCKEVLLWIRDGDSMRHISSNKENSDEHRLAALYRKTQIASKITSPIVLTMANTGGSQMTLAVPLKRLDGSVLGSLVLLFNQIGIIPKTLRYAVSQFSTRLAEELSWIITNQRLQDEIKQMQFSALKDMELDIWKREALLEQGAIAVAAGKRQKYTTSFLLLDLVGLRETNRMHGHTAGDELLAHFVRQLKGNLRANDIVGRVTGGQVGVVLPNTSGAQVEATVIKLKEAFFQTPFLLEGESLPVEINAVHSEVSEEENTIEPSILRCARQLQSAVQSLELTKTSKSNFAMGSTVCGMYKIKHELSRGAMGIVYRAEDLALGRPVAIKVLRESLTKDEKLVSQFRDEAGILASLRHNNLVQIYAFAEQDEHLLFVMELVEGKPLGDILAVLDGEGEFLELDVIGQIIQEIADALDAMHAAGLVHRDVKPHNILLDHINDRAVLVDVGVAKKMHVGGDAAGTPGFAAPESFTADAESSETDVYGLAATTYMMLTNRPPFESGSEDLLSLVTRQLQEDVIPPSQFRPGLSSAVDEVLCKSLSGDPGQRFRSIGAFAMALFRALTKSPSSETPVKTIEISSAPAVEQLIANAGRTVVPMDAPSLDDLFPDEDLSNNDESVDESKSDFSFDFASDFADGGSFAHAFDDETKIASSPMQPNPWPIQKSEVTEPCTVRSSIFLLVKGALIAASGASRPAKVIAKLPAIDSFLSNSPELWTDSKLLADTLECLRDSEIEMWINAIVKDMTPDQEENLVSDFIEAWQNLFKWVTTTPTENQGNSFSCNVEFDGIVSMDLIEFSMSIVENFCSQLGTEISIEHTCERNFLLKS